MKNIIVFLFLTIFASPALCDDLTTETLKRCGEIHLLEVRDGKQFFLSSKGKVRKFPTSVSITSATQIICEEQGINYNKATDPHWGKTYDNKIADVVADKLKSAGFGENQCKGIGANYQRYIAWKNGDITFDDDLAVTSSTIQSWRDESVALDKIRAQFTKEAYAEYPKE